MFEKCLNEAELILSTQKDPLVPVRKVWEELNRTAKAKEFDVASLADFSAMLEGDKRFQIIPASVKSPEEEVFSEGELEDDDMENLGFYAEDRVKLRNRRMIDPVINEDDEEVGSIKRRAFVSRTEKETSDVSKGKAKNKNTKSSIKPLSKKRNKYRIKQVKRKKAANTKKVKQRKPKKNR